jgi:hypothetical protein
VGVCVVQVGFWRGDFDRACRSGSEQYLKGKSDSRATYVALLSVELRNRTPPYKIILN